MTYVLPGSLDGPTTGVLTLPGHLDQFDEQHRRDPVDLIDPQYTDALYKVILNRARYTDDLRHLNHDVLVDAWPRLALPTSLRDQWENRFD